MAGNTLIEAKGIYKSFSGVPVLQDVRFEVKAGEVHALMGENGAGKSTLIKIITGVYTKDDGQIFWEGNPVEINSYQDCQKLGVACIYQELSVIPPLTVAQNVFLGREPRKGVFIDYAKMNKMTQELIDKYQFPLKPTTIVDNLGIGQRQLIEILKGLSQNSKLLIMDEPTASLSGKEAEMLFKIIQKLRSEGVSIIYISHRLEEVYMLSDRLTILRDGKNAAILEKQDIIPAKVIETMIGKVVDESAGSKKMLHSEDTEVRLDVQNLTDKADRFEKKLYDLELTRNISIQMAPQIRLIQSSNQIMAEKIQTSLVNTIPLWKSQMVLALGLAHTENAMKAQRAVTDLTNDLLTKNAEKLHMATVETAKEAERGMVDIETLKHTNKLLIDTMDEVLEIQQQGKEKRRAAEAELATIEGELRAKILEVRT